MTEQWRKQFNRQFTFYIWARIILTLIVFAAMMFVVKACNDAYDRTACETARWNANHPGQLQPIYDVPADC